jgi:hypothetical protein
MSSSGYFTTPRCDEAASFRSRVNSASSAQRIQRCCSGVLRDRTHLRRAQLASFPTVTGMASASRGSHHSCGPSCSVCASDRVRPRRTMSWRTRSGKNPRRLFGGLNPSRLRASAIWAVVKVRYESTARHFQPVGSRHGSGQKVIGEASSGTAWHDRHFSFRQGIDGAPFVRSMAEGVKSREGR